MSRARSVAVAVLLLALLALTLIGAGAPSGEASTDAGSKPGTHEPRCRAFHAANAKTYALLAGCKECTEGLHALFDANECHADAKGVWGMVIERTSMRTSSRDGHEPMLAALEAGWHLVRASVGDTDAAAAVESKTKPFLGPGRRVSDGWVNWSIVDDGWDAITIPAPIYFDFNGDGVDEVILSSHAHTEGYSPAAFEIWTVVNDKVVRYPTGVSTELTGIDDVDHDGRPDLLTIEVGADLPSPIGEPRFVGPTVVYHSLPDGTFSGRDSVARAMFEKECTPQLRKLTAASLPEDDDTLVTHVVCARAAGMPAEALRELLARYRFHEGAVPEMPPPADLHAAIDDAPSFVLK